ncbi:MAG: hypothetical protein K9N07_06745 [Candidatus Cloacimonetes bacterium]|nr:hypothetical protein [Candidatus Cloacimonadota bacterium]
MGTQQILLIVLSVIIVGIAVAVGITMFNAQATNSNRQAIMGDMNNLASSALAFYKTPQTHGGGGNDWLTVDDIGAWLGYDYDTATSSCSTGNGAFVLSVSGDVLTIVGTGTETGNDGTSNVSGQLDVTGATSTIVAQVLN